MARCPAINGWAIFSKADFTTACRFMAKRLRDICGIPESEPLWRAGRGFVVLRLKRSHKIIVTLTVQEILDEQIAKKLV